MSYPFCNQETREVFVEVITAWWRKGLVTAAESWSDIGNGSAIELLARRLRRDYWQSYGKARRNNHLRAVFFRRGLRHVNWKQVARAILEPCQPKPAAEDK